MIRAAPTIERVGAALGLPFAGVHIVEAIKQVYRPVGVRAVARRALLRSILRSRRPPAGKSIRNDR